MANFAQDIFELNRNRPDKVAVTDGTRALTYAELEYHSLKFAAYLQSLAFKPQSRIIFYLDDCIEWPVAFLASLLAGLNPVCVNHNNSPERLEYLINLTDASAVIVDSLPTIDTPVNWLFKQEILDINTSNKVSVYDYHDDEPCFWLLTSGTTNRPKAIVHRHKNLANYVESSRVAFPTDENTRAFATAKLSFAYGLSVMNMTLSAGACFLLMSGIANPSRIFDAVAQHEITDFYTVPTIINAMLKHNKNHSLCQIRHVYSAGEHLPAVISKQFYDTFGVMIRNTIGMSETTAMHCIQNLENYEHGTVGVPFPGVEFRLLDENQQPVNDGEVGELYIKTPCKATQYWKDWTYTNYTFVGDWLRTGDKMQKTRAGNYAYVSRNDDSVKINGHWVTSTEVEAALLEHPDINECAVVFLATDKFPAVHAVIVPNSTDVPDHKDLREFLLNQLPYYKVPSQFHWAESLPKTLTNKIKRTEIRDSLKSC